MAKKIVYDADVEDEMEAEGKPAPAEEPAPEPKVPSDELLMTYNFSEATWLGVHNPPAFLRWQELMAGILAPPIPPEPPPEVIEESVGSTKRGGFNP